MFRDWWLIRREANGEEELYLVVASRASDAITHAAIHFSGKEEECVATRLLNSQAVELGLKPTWSPTKESER